MVFQTFEAHSTDFRSPIGASTPSSKKNEKLSNVGTLGKLSGYITVKETDEPEKGMMSKGMDKLK